MTHHALLLASIACFVLTGAVLKASDRFIDADDQFAARVIILMYFVPAFAGITLLIAYLGQL